MTTENIYVSVIPLQLAKDAGDRVKILGFKNQTELMTKAYDVTIQSRALDVSKRESVEQAFETIGESIGAPTILVNNAGITRDNLLMRMKTDEWDDVVNTNMSSIFHMAKGCLRGMTKARWGRVINISSVVGSMGNMGQANYAAAKAGATLRVIMANGKFQGVMIPTTPIGSRRIKPR